MGTGLRVIGALAGLMLSASVLVPLRSVRVDAIAPAQATATPECVTGSITPTLQLRVEPHIAHGSEMVRARVSGQWFGADSVTLRLVKRGSPSVLYRWNGSRTSEVTMPFLAPSSSGDWQATADANGEGTVCVNGHFLYGYTSVVASPIKLTVAGSMLYLPYGAH